MLERVTAAIHKLGGAATAGDVSALAGVSMREAVKDALAALVAATYGTLQVDQSHTWFLGRVYNIHVYMYGLQCLYGTTWVSHTPPMFQ